MNTTNSIRIGADVGGTFTDVILINGRGELWTHKLPSTPPDFERAVLQTVDHLLAAAGLQGEAVTEVAVEAVEAAEVAEVVEALV